MQHDPFKQVTEGHVVVFGEGLEDFQQAFFHAHAGLHALDFQAGFINHGTNVP